MGGTPAATYTGSWTPIMPRRPVATGMIPSSPMTIWRLNLFIWFSRPQSESAFRSFRNARYTFLDFRYRVELYLGRPGSVNSPQTRAHSGGNIGREVSDEHVVPVEHEAVRPEKADWRAVLADTAEVAELRDHSALLRLEHHHLVGLVARDPNVVVLINDDAVRSTARTVDEDLRCAGLEW